MKQIRLVLLGGLVLAILGFYQSAKPKQPSSPKSDSLVKQADEIKAATPPISDKLPAVGVAAGLTTPTGSLRVPVLMYHHVGDLTPQQRAADAEGSDLTVSVADFQSEVQFLSQAGYHSVSIQQLYDALEHGGRLASKPIVFTFDDGYQDVFTNAIPILQQYGYTGSFGIITAKVGTADYAPWADIISADRAGMEIVSHTEHHPDLSDAKYTEDELHDEIFGAKQILEQELGHAINFFIYPYGRYNAHVEDLLTQAGYQMAFTTAFGLEQNPDALLAEPRVRVHGVETMEKFEFSLGLAPRTAPVPTNP